MDVRRIWIEKSGEFEYKPEEHIPTSCMDDMPTKQKAWKFLYWRDGGDGQALLIVCSRELYDHKMLFEIASEVMDSPPPTTKPDGAGDIDQGGCILTWSSHHFGVNTPGGLLAPIFGMLGVN